MKRFPFQLLPVFLTLVVAAERMEAQEPEGRASMIILRAQAAAISEEILDSLGLALSPGGRVSVSVGNAVVPGIVENALLEALQRRGLTGILPRSDAIAGTVWIHVVVFEQSVKLERLNEAMAARSMRTEIEARFEEENGHNRYLGSFFRAQRDTISANGEVAGISWGSESFLEKIIEPLIVVAGAFLIVYLFFTVRS